MNLLNKFFIILAVLILFIFSNIGVVNSQSYNLFINEVMASNERTVSDDNGEYEDWIEIYNAEDIDINLSGYYLTDELNNPMRWAFPNVTIPAKGYLLIWADDDLNQSGLHANFKLSKDGEQIGLYDGTTFVDSISYGLQNTDVSYGRKSDGDHNWVFFESPNNPPTPGAANVYTYVVTLNPPQFYPNEGFYSGGITVVLRSNDSDALIYYTLNGSFPTTSSIQYRSPISISSPTTIRAICYKQMQPGNEQISDVATKCYLLNIDSAIPLINIVCDPDEHDDIYYYPPVGESHPSISAHYKYFDVNHVLQGDLPIALSMRGAYSLLSPKKSYKVVFTKQNLQYDLFDEGFNYPRSTDFPTSFHSHNLNGMAADYSLIRNYLSFQLLRNAGANTAQVSFSRLFINGNDRAIYIPMERIDNWLVKNRFGNYDYDIIKTGIEHKCDLTMQNENGEYFELVEGDFHAFHDFIVWLNNGNHSYDELHEKMDIPSFLYYDLMCRYSNNKDSYDINYYLIRNRNITNSKWIILIWDTDESFGWDSNVAGNWYPYNEAFYQLRQTNEYIPCYQNTLADLMNTIWSQPAVSNSVTEIENLFSIDNTADENIWNETWYGYAENVIPGFNNDPNYNPLSRYTQFNYIKQWIGDRIDYLYSQWGDNTAILTIDPPSGGEGTIQLNSLHLTYFPWAGTYFQEIPISLKAIPGPSYVFVGWSDSSISQTDEVTITIHNDYSIHPIFGPNTQTEILVINEINYNSSPDFDPEDWIELYNPTERTAYLDGWHLKDDDIAHDFVFAGGITIAPHDFLVICRDTTTFQSLFPGVTDYIGNMDFGLSGNGDQVRIFNPSLLLIDSVDYDDEPPWPIEPDGSGPTLELIDSGWDNTRPRNWQASLEHGTPGQPNSARLIINEINYNSAPEFNPEDWIELYNPSAWTINVSGWHLKDDDSAHDFTFPPGTTIAPYGFLILCCDRALFQNLFPGIVNIAGNFNFGLSSDGDVVKIYDSSHNLVDSVTYNDERPWPTEANGNGSTLELLGPKLDNTIPQNWQASTGHGSPGQATLALPVVTSFIVKDSSGSTKVTNSRDVLIEMKENDYDGHVVKWHINESGIPPSAEEFILENRPTSYHIVGEQRHATIYGWVLDNDNQVNHRTNTSCTIIRLALDDYLYNISGRINYNHKQHPVPDVVMTLTFDQEIETDTTDENGNYVFTYIDTGNVKLLPSKQGDMQGAIRGSDALLVLRHLASLVNLNDDEELAANVTNDEDVTASDAQAIVRHLAFYTDGIGKIGQWRFVPTDSSFTLNSDTTVNFRAYLAGDVNLDWGAGFNPGQEHGGVATSSKVSLLINHISVHEDEYIDVPLIVETDSDTVYTILFSLQYDPVYLSYQATEKTDISNDFMMEANGTETGRVHIAMAGVQGIKSSGIVLRLRFKSVDPSIEDLHTPLIFIRALVNDQPARTSNGEIFFTDTSDVEQFPEDFALYQNYPNPFNSQTRILYQLPVPSLVRITIYNIMGNKIKMLENKHRPVGTHGVIWDGRDSHGTEMPSGIYIYEIKANGFIQSKKMNMTK